MDVHALQVIIVWLFGGLVVGGVLFVLVAQVRAAIRAAQQERERAEARLLWRDWAMASSTRGIRRSVARRGRFA